MSDNIVQIDTIRIDRNKPRKCVCEIRKFTVDTTNREVTCGCGMTVDPFEAMEYLARHYEEVNRQHTSLNEQRKEWLKQKPYSVLFKRLEREYGRGEMLPSCPHCQQTFDFDEITFWTNSMFYKKLKSRQKTLL